MKVVTQQFGELEVAEDKVIYFPNGIIGFEDCNNFIIVDDEDSEPFRWLISLDKKEIGFPVLYPFLVKENYEQEFPSNIIKQLKSDESVMDVFCVVTLKGEGEKVTINLKGPILIDYIKREGKQLILTSDDLPVSHPLA